MNLKEFKKTIRRVRKKKEKIEEWLDEIEYEVEDFIDHSDIYVSDIRYKIVDEEEVRVGFELRTPFISVKQLETITKFFEKRGFDYATIIADWDRVVLTFVGIFGD